MNAATARYMRAALLAILGWSAAFYLLTQLGLGGRYVLHPDDPEAVQQLPELSLARAESQLGPMSEYAVAADRPLFNPDRRPLPASGADAEAEQAPVAPVATPLDVVLTSVIMAGNKHIAIVTDRTGNKTYSLRIGESLAGDQSSWRLVELKPRSAVFEGPAGRSRVDLRVFDGSGGQPPTPVSIPGDAAVEPAPESGDAAEQTPESRAEMIRKRIEERRRQMREEAARANQERGQ